MLQLKKGAEQMTPKQFIDKWRDSPLKERASYQLHFIDLCALLDLPTPSSSSHETYCFERGATRTGAGQGWADVWKKGFLRSNTRPRGATWAKP